MTVNLDLVRQRIVERQEADSRAARAAEERRAAEEEAARQRAAAQADLRRRMDEEHRERLSRFTPTVVLELKSVEMKDPNKPTPGEDVLVGYLRTPASGLDFAEPSPGFPGTEVRVVVQNRPQKPSQAIAFTEVHDLTGRLEMRPGGTVLLTNGVQYDPDSGNLIAGHVGPLTRGHGKEKLFLNEQVSVSLPSFFGGDAKQTVNVLRAAEARRFESPDEFANIAADFLSAEGADGADPAIIVRVIDVTDPVNSAAAYTIEARRDAGGALKDAGATLTNWLLDRSKEAFVNGLETRGRDPNTLYEIVPVWAYTHESSIDNPADEDVKALVRRHYKLPDDDEMIVDRRIQDMRRADMARRAEPFKVSDAINGGFAQGIVAIYRDDADATWRIRHSSRIPTGGPISTRREVVTPNLPVEVAELFQLRAQERGRGLDPVQFSKSMPSPQPGREPEEPTTQAPAFK